MLNSKYKRSSVNRKKYFREFWQYIDVAIVLKVKVFLNNYVSFFGSRLKN